MQISHKNLSVNADCTPCASPTYVKSSLKNIAKRSIATFIVAFTLIAAFAAPLSASYSGQALHIEQHVTTANLNLRSGPSLDHERLLLIPAGSVINVYHFNPTGFSSASFNGVMGYVYSEFIRHIDAPPFVAAPVFEAEAVVEASSTQVNGSLELIPWSDMRSILPTGSVLHITDVNTGITFYVSNFSNGSHADVDPLTQQDTDSMRAASGGQFSWDARPIIVTHNGRSFPAAMNTMPHGGGGRRQNGITGHVCIHFYRSRPHNGNAQYEREMQAAVMAAFNSR